MSHHVLNNVEIEPSVLTDHCLVYADITLFTSDKGPGLFRFRNELLEDSIFIQSAKTEIGKAAKGEEIYSAITDWGLKLELLSSTIRIISIGRWKEKERYRRNENEKFFHKLKECEAELSVQPSDHLVKQYQELKSIVNEIELEKGRRAMIYSSARWALDGEKPSRYFLNLHKSRNAKKQINVFQGENDELITGNKNILACCKDYFQKIYSKHETTSHTAGVLLCDKFLGEIECPKLSQEDRALHDAPITSYECKLALQGMMNNKSPSVSGCSKEFFLHFWDDLEAIVVNYLTQTKERGKFFPTQRRGVITLIPKRGDQKLLRNKRAI